MDDNKQPVKFRAAPPLPRPLALALKIGLALLNLALSVLTFGASFAPGNSLGQRAWLLGFAALFLVLPGYVLFTILRERRRPASEPNGLPPADSGRRSAVVGALAGVYVALVCLSHLWRSLAPHHGSLTAWGTLLDLLCVAMLYLLLRRWLVRPPR